MKNKYTLHLSVEFYRDVKKLTKKNSKLKYELNHKLKLLAEDPFVGSLHTHNVEVSGYGKVYSSRISKDLRVLWIFKGKQIILLHRFGGHSGNSNIYR
ncbi:TPA: hypothetical protein DEP90_00700 [Patescibacteria group bacterium]|nr:hypothetical protein [Patescibacteria group bacterium]